MASKSGWPNTLTNCVIFAVVAFVLIGANILPPSCAKFIPIFGKHYKNLCDECGGDGKIEQACRQCRGKGYFAGANCTACNKSGTIESDCPYCGGSGKKPSP